MSKYYLFNTDNDKAPIEVWSSSSATEEFGCIGDASYVINKLKEIFPRLENWKNNKEEGQDIIYYSCLGEDNCSQSIYLDISVSERRKDNCVIFISVDRASDEILKILMDEFNIKYIFYPEGWKLIEI